MLRCAGAQACSASPHGGVLLRVALAALRILGGLALGLVLGISSIDVVAKIPPDPPGLAVAVIIYAVIGGAVVILSPPVVGLFLLLGWAAPWLLVMLVVLTGDEWVPLPAIVTALYVLALGISWYQTRRRGQTKGNG